MSEDTQIFLIQLLLVGYWLYLYPKTTLTATAVVTIDLMTGFIGWHFDKYSWFSHVVICSGMFILIVLWWQLPADEKWISIGIFFAAMWWAANDHDKDK